MVVDRSWEIVVDELVERPVRAARMLVAGKFGPPEDFGLIGGQDARVVVLDADSDEFVLVPRLPKGLWWSLHMSLSDDGTRLVGSVRGAELFVHTLPSGETRWLNRPEIDGHIMGAFSPDGTHIATLAIVDPGEGLEENNQLIAVETTDLASGAVRTVWQGRGSWTECALGWSPDGQLLVASYLGHEDILSTTIVLDATTGRTIASLQDRIPLNNPHGVWVSHDEFTTFPEVEADIMVVHVDRDTDRVHERHVPRTKGDYRGIGGARYLRSPKVSKERNVSELYTTELDGTDPRTLLSICPRTAILAVDVLTPIV